MKKLREKLTEQQGFGRTGFILIVPFVLLFIAYVLYHLFFIAEPVVKGTKGFDYLSADKTITIEGENMGSIHITLYQAGKMIDLLKDSPETGEKTFTLQIKPLELGFKDGSAIVSIKATSGFFKEIKHEIPSMIDTKPPSLAVLKAPSTISQGGGGFALLRVKGADSVFVRAGDYEFTAYKVPVKDELENEPYNPAVKPHKAAKHNRNRSENYYAFFPIPFAIEEGSSLYAIAKDTAGNRSVRTLSTRVKKTERKLSAITISDSFINRIVSPLLNEIDIADPAAAFKTVNEDWRKTVHEKLLGIVSKTEPRVLWKGRFLQMKNSKVMAGYGEKRRYIYNGEEISRSSHLGYDLASFANAPVEAANSGIIRFAGDLSIYGNTVIIDHGFGLMSLYGHLSTFMVEEGQAVNKGEIIARTGSTGLAGGDHLHFGMLMQGYEVSPLYWWDSHWIRVNITDHMIH